MVKTRISQEGFTLVEVMVAAVILLLAFVGILLSYTRCMELGEMSRNSSTALIAAKSRMETIRNTQFNQIFATYDDVTFNVAGFNGMGVSYVDNTIPDLLQITVTFCWREKNGRIIGEDNDLDGVLDGGEDQNGNGMLDSVVQLVTNVYGG